MTAPAPDRAAVLDLFSGCGVHRAGKAICLGELGFDPAAIEKAFRRG
ncbi:MAG: hypothetical protein ACRECP_10805 [Methylocella sp.]